MEESGAGVLTLWVSLRLRVSQCVCMYVPIYAMQVSVRVYVADSAAATVVFSEKTLLHSTEYGPGAAGLAWRQAVSGGGVDNILILCCTRGCVGDDV